MTFGLTYQAVIRCMLGWDSKWRESSTNTGTKDLCTPVEVSNIMIVPSAGLLQRVRVDEDEEDKI